MVSTLPRGERRSRRQRRVQRRRPRHRHVGREGRRASLGSGHGQARRLEDADGDPVVAVPSPDAAHVVSLSVDSAEPPHTTVALWDRTREEPVATWRLDGRGTGAGFDASGRRLVAWTEDGSRRRLGQSPRAGGLQRSRAPLELRSAALSPDGMRVVTAANDGVARIWDVAGGREVRRFRHAVPVVAASFNADGSRLLTASADGTAKIWDVRTDREPVALRGHQTELDGRELRPDGPLGRDRRASTGRRASGTRRPVRRSSASTTPADGHRGDVRPGRPPRAHAGGRLPRAGVRLRDVRPARRARSPRPQPARARSPGSRQNRDRCSFRADRR